jgi:hypothetical protein
MLFHVISMRPAYQAEVLETPGAFGKGKRSDKGARSECSLLHTPQTSNTILPGTSRKPEPKPTQNIRIQAMCMSEWGTQESRGLQEAEREF